MSFEIHPWKVVETGLDKERMRLSESLTSTETAIWACVETLRKTTPQTPI